MDNEGRLKNLVVDTLDNHRVHRNYLNKEVPQKILERILMSAIRSPYFNEWSAFKLYRC